MEPSAATAPLVSFEELTREIFELWHGADLDTVGRMLRAHLVLEHFITRHIERRNPNLGDLRKARVGFRAKLELLGSDLPRGFRAGIEHVNALRNKYAHRLDYVLTEDDVRPLREKHLPRVAENDRLNPIQTVELFCALVAHVMAALTKIHGQMHDSEVELAQIAMRQKVLGELASEEEDGASASED